jgi:hypothetical protein
MQYAFGSGVMIGTVAGQANPTPRVFGVLQECSVDFSFNVKELMGQNQFPVAVARGVGKIAGKAKFANINTAMFNDLFFAGSTAANEIRTAVNEAGTIPTTPFQITVANSATWVEDLGVYNRTTGRFMTRVASAPAAGQYSVVSGVYTFASADQVSAPSVYITYRYTFTTTTGQVLTITNQALGLQPTFSLVLSQRYTDAAGVSKEFGLKLNACISNKLSFATKLEDFQIPDLDFQAFADSAGNIGAISMAE